MPNKTWLRFPGNYTVHLVFITERHAANLSFLDNSIQISHIPNTRQKELGDLGYYRENYHSTNEQVH